MKFRLPAVILLVAVMPLLGTSLLTQRVEAAKSGATGKGTVSRSFTAHFTGSNSQVKGPGTLTGKFTIHHFSVANKRLMATGVVTGTLKDASGKTQQLNQTVTLPVKNLQSGGRASLNKSFAPESVESRFAMAASCQILHLTIGPIDLNLLGLRIQTNQIVVDITGQTGPGNLLGNLLCGIANLANGFPNLNTILLQDIALLLNQILASL